MYTRCGKYEVHFRSDGENVLALRIQRIAAKCTSGARHYASLTSDDVEQITTRAGVRKSFSTFSQMVYHALIGKSSCLSFSVETNADLSKRIGEGSEAFDVHLEKMDRQSSSSSSSPKIADDNCERLYLTVEYNVDFTSAVFSIPLLAGEPTPWVQERVEPVHSPIVATTIEPSPVDSKRVEPSEGKRVAGLTQKKFPPQSPRSDRQHLAEALQLIQALNSENAVLKKENAMLARLTREKMKEMRRLCESLEEGAIAMAEVKQLREKVVNLRMAAEKAEERAMTAQSKLQRYISASGASNAAGRTLPYSERKPSSTRGSRSPLSTRDNNRVGTGKKRVATRFDTPPPHMNIFDPEVRRHSDAGGPQEAFHPTEKSATSLLYRSHRDEKVGGKNTGPRYRSRLSTPEGESGSRGRYSRDQYKELHPNYALNASEGRRNGLLSDSGELKNRRRANSASSSRCSSRSHERLYHTPTAASREREKQQRMGWASRSGELPGRLSFR